MHIDGIRIVNKSKVNCVEMAKKAFSSSQRLFKENTFNSLARQQSTGNGVPDSLDLILTSVYNHESDLFVNKCDTILQLENAKVNPIKEKLIKDMNEIRRNYIHHPLVIGNFGICKNGKKKGEI